MICSALEEVIVHGQYRQGPGFHGVKSTKQYCEKCQSADFRAPLSDGNLPGLSAESAIKALV
jgi:hypothetical protein